MFFCYTKVYCYNIASDIMIVCTELDKDFENYKHDVKNRKVRFHIKDIFKDHWDDYKIKFAHRNRVKHIIPKPCSKGCVPSSPKFIQ